MTPKLPTCVAVGVEEADIQNADAVHICHREPRGPDFACVAVMDDELLQSASLASCKAARNASSARASMKEGSCWQSSWKCEFWHGGACDWDSDCTCTCNEPSLPSCCCCAPSIVPELLRRRCMPAPGGRSGAGVESTAWWKIGCDTRTSTVGGTCNRNVLRLRCFYALF